MTPRGIDFVAAAMLYDGLPYVLGAEGDLDPGFSPYVRAQDCSELVQVALADIGVASPDGHWNQWAWCKDAGLLVDLETGYATAGALLFVYDGTTEGHVAISRGDGSTIEARGRLYGTGVFSAYGRGFTHAGLVPGLDYATDPPPAPIEPTPSLEEAPAMIHYLVTDDPVYPRNLHLLFDGANVRWIRHGLVTEDGGMLARAGVKTVECTLAEARALVLSFPGIGTAPAEVGAALAW